MTKRCPFCITFDRSDKESEVQSLRELAVHVILAHAGEFQELVETASSEWDGRFAERASRSATEESLRAALDECRQHHADTLAGNERGQHRSATEGRREMSWIAEAIAANLEQAAPVKIEGGSPAREQWLSDVLAVQAAFQSADAGDTFVAAMNDNHSANSEERT